MQLENTFLRAYFSNNAYLRNYYTNKNTFFGELLFTQSLYSKNRKIYTMVLLTRIHFWRIFLIREYLLTELSSERTHFDNHFTTLLHSFKIKIVVKNLFYVDLTNLQHPVDIKKISICLYYFITILLHWINIVFLWRRPNDVHRKTFCQARTSWNQLIFVSEVEEGLCFMSAKNLRDQ